MLLKACAGDLTELASNGTKTTHNNKSINMIIVALVLLTVVEIKYGSLLLVIVSFIFQKHGITYPLCEPIVFYRTAL